MEEDEVNFLFGKIFWFTGAAMRWLLGAIWFWVLGKQNFLFKQYLYGLKENESELFDNHDHRFVNILIGMVTFGTLIVIVLR
jgi:hypothetical protein